MFLNNVIIALRNLRKNKGFAVINISGLALGLTIFVFGSLLIKYEESHDLFFQNADRIYTIGSIAAPELNVGFERMDATFTTVGPIVEAELEDVERVARTVLREFLLSMGSESFYEGIRFADPDILRIFDFEYIHGNETALDDPSGILITDDVAIKYFGHTNVLGEVVTFDNEFDYHVAAIIKQVPLNSHFSSSLVQDEDLGFLVPITALNKMREWDLEGNWNNLSLGNMTYLLLDERFDRDWLQGQMNSLYDRLVPEDQTEVISGFTVSAISGANTAIWDLIGIPVIDAVQLLSFLILVIACVNYTNLATAQSLGRTREVGMRKTMGATQTQLLTQFLIESLVIATIAMIIAIAALEIIIPLFNNASSKILSLNYASTLPWLLATTILVGLFAGLYPAWLITKTSPIEALRDIARKGKKGAKMRSFMIGVQFAISAFMLATVSIVYMQNERIKESSYEFPRSEIYTIDRLRVEGIEENLDTLKVELEALPNVDVVAFSSQVPYEQNNSNSTFTPTPGDEAAEFSLMRLDMSPDFLRVYDIPVLTGRPLSRDMTNDIRTEESEVLNVLVNELALPILGYASATAAINQSFYTLDPESTLREFVIVGVVPTQNIVGLFNQEKAWFYEYVPAGLRIGSIRIKGGNIMDTVDAIEGVWNDVIPNYPIQGRFLDEVFNDVYDILRFMNMALAGFAFIALSLALIGLFGLAAFMAALRTKEIGVRKVLGASSAQIARLLVWQFSRPVLWALLVALPLAYFSSQIYLDFFADRINSRFAILLIAGLVSVLLAWATIAGHAIRIARANPIRALRYE
ncbi:MAG: FtsX-like permease family protein [Gammaproteobacteria bacterium]|nr:FtsX-like permease family protein [Gammaproteobacteria bacterium]